jgi:hypothetical protein
MVLGEVERNFASARPGATFLNDGGTERSAETPLAEHKRREAETMAEDSGDLELKRFPYVHVRDWSPSGAYGLADSFNRLHSLED